MRTMTGEKNRGCARRGQRGFTLIEMVVITVVLLIMAGAIAPNLVAITTSRQAFIDQAALQRAPLEARNEAVHSQMAVTMRVQTTNGSTTLVMSHLTKDNNEQQYRQVLLGSLRIEGAQLNGVSSDLASWKWTVYPDGSSDSGGLQLTVGKTRLGLVMTHDGGVQWVQGDLPDNSSDSWQAGELQQNG